mgnify:CR=1 FL=1
MKKSIKIFILGCNGFIGNALVEKLIKHKNIKIIGIDINSNNLSNLKKNKNFIFHKGDVNKKDAWIKNTIKKSDIIIPLVAIATPKVYVTNPLFVFQLDFESNLKVIKYVAQYNKRLIFPSTSEVYGMTNDQDFNEYKTNLTVGPISKSRWIYSCSKQLLDRVIHAYGENDHLNYTIFRPFNWIGPKLDDLKKAQLGNGRVMIIFIEKILKNKNIVLVDGGKQTRSFTYLDDGINALENIILLDNNKTKNKIFNIGNPKNNCSIKDLANYMIKYFNSVSKKKYKGKVIVKSQRNFYGKNYEDIPHRVPDISEAIRYIGWNPSFNLQESIKRTMDYYI